METYERFHRSLPSERCPQLSSSPLSTLPTRQLEPRGAKPQALGPTAGQCTGRTKPQTLQTSVQCSHDNRCLAKALPTLPKGVRRGAPTTHAHYTPGTALGPGCITLISPHCSPVRRTCYHPLLSDEQAETEGRVQLAPSPKAGASNPTEFDPRALLATTIQFTNRI